MSSLYGNAGYGTGRLSRSGATGNMIPKGYSQARIDQFTPEGHQLLSDLYQRVGPDSFLAQLAGGKEGAFDQLEAPALRQFNALQGNIASRFSGAGLGGRHSSGFQNSLGQASSDFAQQLQSNRLNLMRQAYQDLMGFSNDILNQRPYENTLVEKPKRWIDKFVGGATGAIVGGGLGYASGGYKGALQGGAQGFNAGYSGGI